MMRRLVIFAVAVLLGAGSIAFADDLVPPPWRGDEGSTFQEWTFSTPVLTPPPDVVLNPYGDPLLRLDSCYWIEYMDQRTRKGIWTLSGEIDVYIPNVNRDWPEKHIWVQLTWKPGTLQDPYLPNEPIVGVNPFKTMAASRTDTALANGWVHSVFAIDIWPNPIAEWVAVKGDILVDQLVIDTICVPEPMTVTLLGLGGLALLGNRRRR